jgi:hypothetical protein
MRKLLYVPLLHHATNEMGDEYRELMVNSGIQVRKAEKYSDRYIREAELKLADYEIDKIYIDSMHEGGDNAEAEVKKLRREGSYMAKVVLDIADRGARLMKTESLPVLRELEEIDDRYFEMIDEVVKKVKGKKKDAAMKSLQKMMTYMPVEIIRMNAREEVLEAEREAYIGRRISGTLRNGETGVLFIGAYHEPKFRHVDVKYVISPKRIDRETEKVLFGKKAIRRVSDTLVNWIAEQVL